MKDEAEANKQYANWKQTIPYLYDWFSNHNLTWPSLCCRWGPLVDEGTYKRKQRLYLSERTDGTDTNKLVVVSAEVLKERVAAADTITGFAERNKSPYIKHFKTILHPGEVNKIRECPMYPNIVVTHTDARELYVWDVDRQADRSGESNAEKQKMSVADLTLTGHSEAAEFALGMSSAGPLVASGGQDANVLVWNLEDHGGGALLGKTAAGAATQAPTAPRGQSPALAARATLKGHGENVEDVAFTPGSGEELASVGDDFALLFWDTRSGASPVSRVPEAHGQHDLHCLDWSGLQPHLLATGAADGSLRVWDRRNLGQALNLLELHQKAVMRIEWAPYRSGVLGSGGNDGLICVWDLERRPPVPAAEGAPEYKKARASLPHTLMFQHAGHRQQVADFQWHPSDPFLMMSVSDDGAGGTLQMWRITDLVWKPEDEILRELEPHREFILFGEKGLQGSEPPAAAAPAGPGVNVPIARTISGTAASGGSAPASTPASAFVAPPKNDDVDMAEAGNPDEAGPS